MPGAESRADMMLSCGMHTRVGVGAGAVRVGERRKNTRGSIEGSKRSLKTCLKKCIGSSACSKIRLGISLEKNIVVFLPQRENQRGDS